MDENNSPPPLMTDKELLMEDSAHSEIMAAAFEYADAYCSSGDEPRRYKAAIDNLRKTVRAEIARFSRGNYKAPQHQVEPASHVINDDVLGLVSLALRKAWQLGQTYWQQADSEFISQQNKSDATRAKFQALIDETRAALATTQPAAAVNQQLTAEQPAPAGEYPALPLAEYKSWANGGLLRNDGYTAEQMRAYADDTHAMRAGEQEPVFDYPHEQMDALALARYKVVPSDQSMYWRHAVVAGDGQQHLYNGSEVNCQNMARKFAGAFLDGAFAFHSRYTSPVATQGEQMDAIDRECLAIGRAINRAAGELPADGEIRIEIENGAVVVYVNEPKHGDWRYIDSSDVFSAQINAAIDAALSATTPPNKKDGA